MGTDDAFADTLPAPDPNVTLPSETGLPVPEGIAPAAGGVAETEVGLGALGPVALAFGAGYAVGSLIEKETHVGHDHTEFLMEAMIGPEALDIELAHHYQDHPEYDAIDTVDGVPVHHPDGTGASTQYRYEESSYVPDPQIDHRGDEGGE